MTIKNRTVQAWGDVVQISARGAAGGDMFTDDFDYEVFLYYLERTKEHTPFDLHAFALVPRGVELLLGIRQVGASGLAHRLLRPYALYANRKHGRIGHAIEKRHDQSPVSTSEGVAAAITSVHALPVRLGLASKPEDWPWSGHRESAGQRPPRLLDSAPGPNDLRSPYDETVPELLERLILNRGYFPKGRRFTPEELKARKRRCRV